MEASPYALYYWPTIQGRGEFVRLALEEGGAPYVDVARGADGVKEMMRLMKSGDGGLAPFAPPFLRADGLLLAQTANILAFLGPRLSLVEGREADRAWALQLQLTIADLVNEVHDTHHPVSTGLHYEDQKPEARRRSEAFLRERLPKYLGYLERALGGGKHLVGGSLSYVDLSAFQVLSGLDYAFPRAMRRIDAQIPRLRALRDLVAARPRIRAYLASERRLPFNQDGIFRHYPELDA